MLGLKLREEFRSPQMPGTVIDLNQMVGAGAATNILAITYPTFDVRKALLAVAAGAERGRPVVVIGERGRGKSHILSLLHYAFLQPEEVERWAPAWQDIVGDPTFLSMQLSRGFTPISEGMVGTDCTYLWDPIFRGLKKGDYVRGQFRGSGTSVPSRSLLIEAFTEQPTALILDELQTWYDSLPSQPRGGSPQELAFAFLQVLSELASDRPDVLRLVVSVRNSDTEAFRQLYRSDPLLVDFKGASAQQDRVRLVQHRLFENHRQMIGSAQVRDLTATYADERVRLLFPGGAGPTQEDRRQQVRNSWPFAPELLTTIEDEILMAATAQGDRDLIRILARMFKARGEVVPLLTVADIDIEEDGAGARELASMVDVIAGAGTRLREVALRNLEAVRDQQLGLEHDAQIISALWVRSLSPGPRPGATSRQLHLDVTRNLALDDNLLDEELSRLRTASFNIHEVGDRLLFKLEENPRAKLKASARNNKLFGAGQDTTYIQQAIAQALNPMDAPTTVATRLIVLGSDWERQPWAGRSSEELPGSWRDPVVIVVPEPASSEQLALWLRNNVNEQRNVVRFLIPGPSKTNPYRDQETRELARCAYLAGEWGKNDAQYRQLLPEYQRPLRERLASWFDRLAVLRLWDFQTPANSRFVIDSAATNTQSVLKWIEEHIATAIFDPGDFKSYVLRRASEQAKAYEIIASLMEPRPYPDTSIPYLGEVPLYERILGMAAGGEVALNVGNSWYRREPGDLDFQMALQRIRSSGAYVLGRHLQNVIVALPGAVPLQPAAPQSATSPASTEPRVSERPGDSATTASQSGGATAPAVPQVRTLRSEGARTAVNLLGELYRWQLTGRRLRSVRLETSDLPFADLKDLLQRLPPRMQLKLEVEAEEVGQ